MFQEKPSLFSQNQPNTCNKSQSQYFYEIPLLQKVKEYPNFLDFHGSIKLISSQDSNYFAILSANSAHIYLISNLLTNEIKLVKIITVHSPQFGSFVVSDLDEDPKLKFIVITNSKLVLYSIPQFTEDFQIPLISKDGNQITFENVCFCHYSMHVFLQGHQDIYTIDLSTKEISFSQSQDGDIQKSFILADDTFVWLTKIPNNSNQFNIFFNSTFQNGKENLQSKIHRSQITMNDSSFYPLFLNSFLQYSASSPPSLCYYFNPQESKTKVIEPSWKDQTNIHPEYISYVKSIESILISNLKSNYLSFQLLSIYDNDIKIIHGYALDDQNRRLDIPSSNMYFIIHSKLFVFHFKNLTIFNIKSNDPPKLSNLHMSKIISNKITDSRVNPLYKNICESLIKNRKEIYEMDELNNCPNPEIVMNDIREKFKITKILMNTQIIENEIEGSFIKGTLNVPTSLKSKARKPLDELYEKVVRIEKLKEQSTGSETLSFW